MALTKISTPGIKDEAITLAKLLHGDSNSNGKFLRANNGADPTFETIDLTALSASNLTSGTIPDARFPATLPAISGANLTGINTDLVADTSPQLGGDLDTNSNDINFDTNDKAQFGNAAQLKISYNGTNSEITAGGNGDLNLISTFDDVLIQAQDNVFIKPKAGEDGIKVLADSAVELYHNNLLRFYTRSNGGTIQGTSTNVGIDFSTDGAHRGTVYANNLNQIGFLDTGGDWAIKHTNDSQTEFYIQTNRKAAIDADGLKFNNDTAAANAISDYEEGSWTPTLTNVFAAGTSSGRVNVYRKIGSLVFFTLDIFASGSNMDINTNGDTIIGGLPFTPLSSFNSSMNIAIYMHNTAGQQMNNYIDTTPQIVLHGSSRINNVRHIWGFGCYAVQ